MSVEGAKKHIARAKKQLERVQTAWFDSQEAEQAVTWGFYAYENCVTALAERYGYQWTPNHRKKADLARRLCDDGLISRDVGDDLEEFNRLRKDVAYGEPGYDLLAVDLEELLSELEEFVEEVESRIGSSK